MRQFNTQCSVDNRKGKYDYNRDGNSLKNFVKDLKEHATKIIDYQIIEMVLLTGEENESYS